jgi:pyridoxal phosphate enzyme (YggS family)
MITPVYEARLERSLGEIRERIARAAERSGRDPDGVTLVAVTKAHALAAVEAAIAHGLFDLGENRVDDLAEKANAVADERVRWHMIGHLQSRKAPRVLGIADLVHSVDSPRLARRLSNAAEEAGRRQLVLVQVNTSGEETKGGLPGGEIGDDLRDILALPGLEIRGLMTMAPFTDDETVLRDTFRAVRELNDKLRHSDGYVGEELSMGMTNDFEIAIEEGSTMIRLGTALFGGRTA